MPLATLTRHFFYYEHQTSNNLRGSYQIKTTSGSSAVQAALDFTEELQRPDPSAPTTPTYHKQVSPPSSSTSSAPADSPSPATAVSETDEAKNARSGQSALIFGMENLSPAALAMLSIVNRLPNRYSPERLAVSVGAGNSERVGLAGWLIDQALGRDADFDEETAKIVIGDLCERSLIRVNEFQKLEAVDKALPLHEF